MRVKLRTSIGTADAKAFGLDHAKCSRGATIEVTPEQAEAMRRKYKSPFVETEMHAVAPRPAITAPAKTDK